MAVELEENLLKLLVKGKVPMVVFPGYNNEKTIAELLQRNQDAVGASVVIYLQYSAPEQSFQEIRRLQERVKHSLGIHVNQKLLVAVNATEWLGHEEERYWEIFRKFVSDMALVQGWNFIFYVEGQKKTQAMEMFTSLLQYLKASLLVEKPLEKASIIEALLKLDKQAMFEANAVEYLADKIFKQPSLEKQMEFLVEDLLDNCPEEKVKLEFTRSHLAKPESLYHLLSKNKAKRKEKTKGGNRIGISL